MIKSIIKYYFLFIVVFLSIQLNAQQCEWLNIGGEIHVRTGLSKVIVDRDSNVIAIGAYNISYNIGSYFLPTASLLGSPLLVKYDNQGNIKWAFTATSPLPPVLSNNQLGFYSITTDNDNNIYISGIVIGSFSFGNNVSVTNLNQSKFDSFILKIDPNGVSQWVKMIDGDGRNHQIKMDTNDNLYLALDFNDTLTVIGTNNSLITSSFRDVGVLKFSKNGDLLKMNSFGGVGHELVSCMDIDEDNNLYIGGYSDYNFNVASKSLNDSGQVIIKLNSSLDAVNAIKIYNNNIFHKISGISVAKSGKLVIVNEFFDSINFGNNIYLKRKIPPINNIPRSVGIAYFDSTLIPIWARLGDNDTSATFLSTDVIIENGNIYFGGTVYGKVSFGANTISSVRTVGKFAIIKMDTLGNFLWAFSSNDSSNGVSKVTSFAVDKVGDVYMVGIFRDSIAVFNKRAGLYSGPGPGLQTGSFFAAKIVDYTITRGYVKSGPYCAGDTIKIPYTKKGTYSPNNEFIAELSDSAGNFDGGHRELGRITDSSSGVINGRLPLFNVATTNKYRVRIISTKPIVQSYYRIDTLRLLIYSKDSANAGKDTLLCRGEKVQLTTTGGSKWLWTPTVSIQNKDSTNRDIWVQPDSTTEYRIIISDSSGCGVTDTDYVKIYIRPDIETKIIGDTVICKGYEQQLEANATGGESNHYWYLWKDGDYGFTYSKTNTLYSKKQFTVNYLVIVGDSCSNKIDSTYFTVRVVNNLKANPSKDTTICKGKTANLKVIGTGCNPSKYTYEWTEKGNSKVLSNNNSITVNPTTTTQYQVILKDTSTLLIDTATITVTVDSIFNITTTTDSTICLGQSIDLTANVFSCDTSNMIYTWDNGLGTGKTKTISPTSTTTYTVIGENTFNQLKDTAQVTITVRDPLSLTLNQDSIICIGETAELRAITSGGLTTNHNIQWSEAGSQWSVNTKNVKVTPTQTTTYKAILSDGCTVNNDSAEITITVRPKLEVSVNQDSTICIGEEAELRATATGGLTTNHNLKWSAVGSQWSVNTKNASVTPVTTTTYKALLSDGCTTPNDSAELTITVRAPLSLTVNQDSTICIGEEAELRAATTGGEETNHNILWSEVGSQWSVNTKDIKVSPSTTTTYKAVLSDNCTIENDSSEITITVRAPLQLTTAAKDSICSNELLLLTATPSGGLISNHNIQWNTDNSTWTSTQNPATDTPQVTTQYIATLTDNCSPPVQDTLQVLVLPVPTANFTVNPTFGCPPLTVTLTDNSTDNDSTQNAWTIGLGEYQGTKTQTHELLKTGTYNIKLNVKNQLGCSDEKTQTRAITVFTKPKANFIIKPDIKEVEEPLQLYNISQNYTSVIWDMGDGNIITPQYGKDTSYKYHEDDTGQRTVQLIAINNQGCKDTSTKTILLFNKVNCSIPSAFTPNGDGLNNTFKPVCVGVGNYTLTIYNRWGQVIYQRENGAWNGMYADQPTPAGVYMYKIQIKAQSKKKKLTYGTVQLIR